MIGWISTFTCLLAMGAHVVVPKRLASCELSRRRLWALTALPLLLLAVVTFLVWLRDHPDSLVALGWGTDPFTTHTGQAAILLTAMLVLADLLVWLGYRRIEPRAWRLLSLFALPALMAASAMTEILRVGQGPRTTLGALALALAGRVAVALAAGEALTPRSRRPASPRPRWTLPAGALLLLYPLTLPPETRMLLASGGDLVSLAAGALLLVAARWLPPRLRRPTILAATLVTAAFLARTTELAETFPIYLRPLPAL